MASEDLRRALQDAYSLVQSKQTTATYQTLTFEECLSQELEALVSDDNTSRRPSALTRVRKSRDEFLRVVDQLKRLPDEDFVQPDPNNDVNTPK